MNSLDIEVVVTKIKDWLLLHTSQVTQILIS